MFKIFIYLWHNYREANIGIYLFNKNNNNKFRVNIIHDIYQEKEINNQEEIKKENNENKCKNKKFKQDKNV